MFIIDNKGILRQITINDRPVGRNAIETRRILKALQDAEISQECTPKTGSKRRKKKSNYICMNIYILIFFR